MVDQRQKPGFQHLQQLLINGGIAYQRLEDQNASLQRELRWRPRPFPEEALVSLLLEVLAMPTPDDITEWLDLKRRITLILSFREADARSPRWRYAW